jgi:hypothetical protein
MTRRRPEIVPTTELEKTTDLPSSSSLRCELRRVRGM